MQFFIFTLLFSLLVQSATPPLKFELVDSNKEDKTFVATDVIVTIKSDPLKLSDVSANNTENLKNFFQDKARLLRLIGITNWTANKVETKKETAATKIFVQGSYKNGSDETIYFTEIYYVTAASSRLYLVTSEKNILNEQVIESALALK